MTIGRIAVTGRGHVKLKVTSPFLDPQIAICDDNMFARGRALHSRNAWGFAAGGGGDSLPDNFLAVPR